ncbi:Hsp20/alpha crystallin family protein [Roseobacter sinensis]|uniref:Hsp20/alpha crystallin family protein n=1 Tax=Roseobacter sinensis TaxID=2931391 RepID=A0ABT3BD64_9RHOB|nr:Hsp20/alpha crystallin family protein [Roseobacter sp. WL0113]MCV3271490.1 Hsp20/alpha crystallin family protein [Roseobacter sp. WL0113]
MSRQSLPGLPPESDTSPFFPSFQREINRLIDQFRAGFPGPETADSMAFGTAMFPAIDVVEREDAVEISAEVPGVREEDLDAFISGDVLTLKGKKSSEHKDEKEGYHRIERQYGSFRRQIPLGFHPDDEAVEASFSDGVLKLRIAKPAAAKSGIRKIDISKS